MPAAPARAGAVVVLAVSLTTSAGQSNDAGETNTATSAAAVAAGPEANWVNFDVSANRAAWATM